MRECSHRLLSLPLFLLFFHWCATSEAKNTLYSEDYYHSGTCDSTTPVHHNGNGNCEIKHQSGSEFLVEIRDEDPDDLGTIKLMREHMEWLSDGSEEATLNTLRLHYGQATFRISYTHCPQCDLEDMYMKGTDHASSLMSCSTTDFKKLLFVGNDRWWTDFEETSPFVRTNKELIDLGEDAPRVTIDFIPELFRIGFEQGEKPTTAQFLECLVAFEYIEVRWDYTQASKTVQIDDVVLSAGAAPPTVETVSPVPVYSSGGYTITVGGNYFFLSEMTDHVTKDQEEHMYCVIGNDRSIATIIDLNTAECELPRLPVGAVTLELCHIVDSQEGRADICGLDVKTMQVIETPKIVSVTPGTSSIHGGLDILLKGENFIHATEGVALFCAFGEEQAEVEWVSQEKIRCVSPPADEASVVDVKLTFNGAHYVVAPNQFIYHAANPTTMHPHSGVTDGGTPVTITGTGFVNARDDSVLCRFGEHEVVASHVSANSVVCPSSSATGVGPVSLAVTFDHGQEWIELEDEFVYALPADSIMPNTGHIEGDTLITYGLADGVFTGQDLGHIFCKFGQIQVPATAASLTEVLCNTPEVEDAGPKHVYVSLDEGVVWLKSTMKFFFYEIATVEPSHSPWSGGTDIVVSLRGLEEHESYNANCRFGDSPAVNGLLGKEGDITTITCVTLRNVGDEPETDITVTINGGGEDTAPFGYYAVEKVLPTSGPSGITVTIHGRGFDLPSHYPAYCHFGFAAEPVVAERFDTKVTCPVPVPDYSEPITTSTLEVRFGDSEATHGARMFSVYGITKLEPDHVPYGAESLVTIRGYGFGGLQEAEFPVCQFVHGSKHPLVIEEEGIYIAGFNDAHGSQADGIVCRTPGDFTTALTFLEVSPTGFDFTDNRLELTIFGVTGLHPTVGPMEGGTIITLEGVGFYQDIAKCLFDDRKSTSATIVSETQVTCPTPPMDHDRKHSVSLQLGESLEPCADVFDFEYYGVQSVEPSFGPNTGGMPVRVEVFGFDDIVYASCVFDRDDGRFFYRSTRLLSRVWEKEKISVRAEITDGGLVCVLPRADPGVVYVKVEGEGLDPTGGRKVAFGYYGVNDVIPASMPVTGDSQIVTILGEGFHSTDDILCKVGNNEVVGKYSESLDAIICNALVCDAGMNTVEVSLSGADYYTTGGPLMRGYDIFSVFSSSSDEGALVTIRGEGFYDAEDIMVRTGSMEVAGTYRSAEEVTFRSPDVFGVNPVIEVSFDENDWTENNIRLVTFSLESVEPSIIFSSGGQKLNLEVRGATSHALHLCVFTFHSGHKVKHVTTHVEVDDDDQPSCRSPPFFRGYDNEVNIEIKRADGADSVDGHTVTFFAPGDVLVSSTFEESDDETESSDQWSLLGSSNPPEVVNGALTFVDHEAAEWAAFEAPIAMLGDLRLAYQTELQFKLGYCEGCDDRKSFSDDVVLIGSQGKLKYDLDIPDLELTPEGRVITIPLDERGGWVAFNANEEWDPSQEEFLLVLADVKHLEVRCDFARLKHHHRPHHHATATLYYIQFSAGTPPLLVESVTPDEVDFSVANELAVAGLGFSSDTTSCYCVFTDGRGHQTAAEAEVEDNSHIKCTLEPVEGDTTILYVSVKNAYGESESDAVLKSVASVDPEAMHDAASWRQPLFGMVWTLVTTMIVML